MSHLYGISPYVILYFGLALIIGYLLAALLIRLTRGAAILRVIAWANLITWIIPILGVTTAAMTFRFARAASRHEQTKYVVLATIAFVLATGGFILAELILPILPPR